MKTSDLLASLGSHLQPCVICDGMSFERLARHDRTLLGIETVGCRKCGLVQSNPRPSAQGLEVFYREHYRIYYQGATSPDSKYIAELHKNQRLDRTVAFFVDVLKLPTAAIVLDYGCGEGSLFAALRRAGFASALYGVELNSSFAEYASQLGGALVTNTIATPEPVDLIVVNHVLEHLPDPIGTLRALGALLKPGGRIYIDVPDAEAYDKIQDLHVAHIFHFTERTLRRLVGAGSFHVAFVEKHAPLFHPRSIRMVAEHGSDLSIRPTSPETEQAAWAAVRRSGSALKTLPLRLRRIPGARPIIRFAKRLLGRTARLRRNLR